MCFIDDYVQHKKMWRYQYIQNIAYNLLKQSTPLIMNWLFL